MIILAKSKLKFRRFNGKKYYQVDSGSPKFSALRYKERAKRTKGVNVRITKESRKNTYSVWRRNPKGKLL